MNGIYRASIGCIDYLAYGTIEDVGNGRIEPVWYKRQVHTNIIIILSMSGGDCVCLRFLCSIFFG
jgi:hypothetical protein